MNYPQLIFGFVRDNLTLLSALGTASAAIAAGAFALNTYRKGLAQKRVEWLNQLYDRFFFQKRFDEIRRIIDYARPEEISRLKAAIERNKAWTKEDIDLEEKLVDFLNFFNLVAAVRKLKHIKLDEVKFMFEYYLCRIGDHDFLMDYLKSDGFSNLADLVTEVRATEIMPNFLFVYGTLKRGTEAKMSHFLARYADYYRDGTWQGRLYRLNGYPGAIPSDDPNDVIHGEVFRLRQPTRALSGLDEYEETASGLFRREVFPITVQEFVAGGDTETQTSHHKTVVIRAWVYIYNKAIDGKARIESGRFEKI